jgi:hypothetical protein
MAKSYEQAFEMMPPCLKAQVGTGYLLQMWQTRPEDWPLVVWEMDGFSLEAAKARAEGLANQRVPVIVEGERP